MYLLRKSGDYKKVADKVYKIQSNPQEVALNVAKQVSFGAPN